MSRAASSTYSVFVIGLWPAAGEKSIQVRPVCPILRFIFLSAAPARLDNWCAAAVAATVFKKLRRFIDYDSTLTTGSCGAPTEHALDAVLVSLTGEIAGDGSLK